MKSLPRDNPISPWESQHVEYLEDPPQSPLEVYEDDTRSILSKNDSPDLGFTWSVNPYRGCYHGCAYCLSGDTPILMGDGTTKLLGDLRIGDVVYGTVFDGKYHRYARTRVLACWRTVKPAYRVCLENGTELITSDDHRFLTHRGWKHVTNGSRGQRPHLTLNDKLLGIGGFEVSPPETEEYKRGYLCGMVRGDGLLKVFRYDRPGRRNGDQYQFRLALVDLEAIRRTRSYLQELDVSTHEFVFAEASPGRRRLNAIRTLARGAFERIQQACSWPESASIEWSRGFLAGIFDAEGSYSGGILRITNGDDEILGRSRDALSQLGIDSILEPRPLHVSTLRVRGGLRQHLRFFHLVQPTIRRKTDIAGQALKSNARLRVMSIEPLGIELPMVDITTGTEDFIANGVVAHNCYARPTHEYLGFGAGTDFERKIVVKRRAAELLRKELSRPSWTCEGILFSGNTDCYQPLEASYRLTRACLEACADFANPAYLITKAPLIERDLDVLRRLSERADLGVTLSIPFWDAETARILEPGVATPARRFVTIERLTQAGIEVSVNVAPVIPGLTDRHIPRILEAAAAAGARSAAMTMLRLPGSVREVFESRLRANFPLAAERVLSRTREVRGGRLNDPRFGSRMRGEGEYAEAIEQLFRATAKRLGLSGEPRMARKSALRDERIPPPGTQLRLFDK